MVATLQTISIDIARRRIATITLNRPDRGNAFNQTMLNELGDALKALTADQTVRVLVLRGAGKHFCTGADLVARAPDGQAPAMTPPPPAKYALRDVLASLDGLAIPTIAVIQGGAVGGGAGLVSCCDIAVATEAAFFSIPEVRVGMPPYGIMPFMIRAIGHRAFRRYGLSGERMGAAEALRLGLVHELCETATLEATLAQTLDALLLGGPHAISDLKTAAARYASPNLSDILAQTYPPHDPKAAEPQEGIASFREKRKPGWYPPQ